MLNNQVYLEDLKYNENINIPKKLFNFDVNNINKLNSEIRSININNENIINYDKNNINIIESRIQNKQILRKKNIYTLLFSKRFKTK